MTSTEASNKTNIMSFFPLKEARKSQEIVIREIEKVFNSGKRIVILEAPVGSGKSAIAVTLANWLRSAHVITPRKSLQDQYFDDFQDSLVLMKGRNAYACTNMSDAKKYHRVIKAIETGKSSPPVAGEYSCAEGPCRESEAVYKSCTRDRPCPYSVAIDLACKSPTVVHNIHSFIFQTQFGGKFEPRPLLVIDEGHEIEGAIRDFITKKISVPGIHEIGDYPGPDAKLWFEYLTQEALLPKELPKPIEIEPPPWDEPEGETEPAPQTPREAYLERVSNLVYNLEMMGKFVVKTTPVKVAGRQVSTSFEFIPDRLGNAAERLLFSYGEKVLIMSGTIYDKEVFCRNVGINPAEVQFIRVPSSFPAANRPIYCKAEYQVDTSHANWAQNLDETAAIINRILGIFHNVKGLIHAPSYMAAQDLVGAIKSDRVITHSKVDLQSVLTEFYDSDKPLVLVSPTCQQGVDFKDDRARFQIITRIPYLNTGDEFVSYKVKEDFPWYNYQALVVFGQQIGRVNRSEEDFGATFLLDDRFGRFLSKNSKKLPKWLTDAIVYRN